jgi:hypothetical protein
LELSDKKSAIARAVVRRRRQERFQGWFKQTLGSDLPPSDFIVTLGQRESEQPSFVRSSHLERFDFLLLPAFFKAIATACFCGLPAFISILMFELIVFREEPFLRGMDLLLD